MPDEAIVRIVIDSSGAARAAGGGAAYSAGAGASVAGGGAGAAGGASPDLVRAIHELGETFRTAIGPLADVVSGMRRPQPGATYGVQGVGTTAGTAAVGTSAGAAAFNDRVWDLLRRMPPDVKKIATDLGVMPRIATGIDNLLAATREALTVSRAALPSVTGPTTSPSRAGESTAPRGTSVPEQINPLEVNIPASVRNAALVDQAMRELAGTAKDSVAGIPLEFGDVPNIPLRFDPRLEQEALLTEGMETYSQAGARFGPNANQQWDFTQSPLDAIPTAGVPPEAIPIPVAGVPPEAIPMPQEPPPLPQEPPPLPQEPPPLPQEPPPLPQEPPPLPPSARIHDVGWNKTPDLEHQLHPDWEGWKQPIHSSGWNQLNAQKLQQVLDTGIIPKSHRTLSIREYEDFLDRLRKQGKPPPSFARGGEVPMYLEGGGPIPAYFMPEYMDLKPSAALRRAQDNALRDGHTVADASKIGRAIADYVLENSNRPETVYERTLMKLTDAGVDIEEAMRRARAAGDFEMKRRARGYATGGSVDMHPGGPQGTDTVPAWLTPGEYVVPADAAVKNRTALENMRNGATYMADGGQVNNPNNDLGSDAQELGNIFKTLAKVVTDVVESMSELADDWGFPLGGGGGAGGGSTRRSGRGGMPGMSVEGIGNAARIAGAAASGNAGAVVGAMGGAAALGPVGAMAMAVKEARDAINAAVIGGLRNAIGGAGSVATAIADPNADPSVPIGKMGDAASQAGEKIAEVLPALGYFVVAAGEGAKALSGLMQAIDKTADRYGEFSPGIAQAQATAEIRQITGDVRRSQVLEGEMVKYLNAQSELQQKFEDTKVKLLSMILPLVTTAVNILEVIMPVGEGITSAIGDVASPLTAIAGLIGEVKRLFQADKDPPADPTEQLNDPLFNTVGGGNQFDPGWTPRY